MLKSSASLKEMVPCLMRMVWMMPIHKQERKVWKGFIDFIPNGSELSNTIYFNLAAKAGITSANANRTEQKLLPQAANGPVTYEVIKFKGKEPSSPDAFLNHGSHFLFRMAENLPMSGLAHGSPVRCRPE